jgi:DNA-binding SARP family transcriptional activator
MALGDRGDEEDSIQNLEKACELLEECEAARYAAVARFRLGHRLFSSRRYADSLGQLAQASIHAEAVGSAAFLLSEARRSPLLVEYASSKPATKRFYSRLMRELRDQPLPSADVGDIGKPVSELASIEVWALGNSRVLLNEREITTSQWQTSKSKEMFFYLLLKPGWQHREAIVVDLWPEVSDEQGKRMFHITLHRLRQALYPGCVIQEGGMYRLNPLALYKSDVGEFQQLVASSRKNTELLERAIELYRGEFLPDCYSEWGEELRRELEAAHLNALREVAELHSGQGAWGKALLYWERLAAESPYEEHPNLQIVSCMLNLNRRGDATRHLQKYLDLLRSEAMAPSSVVMQQYESLARGAPAA